MRKRKRWLSAIRASGKPHIHSHYLTISGKRTYDLTMPSGIRMQVTFGGTYLPSEKKWASHLANMERQLCV